MAGSIGEVQLDALPYSDQGYEEPGVREMALRMVEDETKRYRPTKNYLEYFPTPTRTYETPLLKAELERISNRQPMEMLSMKRYELPQPAAGQKNDIAAWQDAANNSCAQLEHQAGRIINLELLSQYGSQAWRLHNEQLVLALGVEQNQLKSIRNKIQEVNWQRKQEQTAAGEELSLLENHWSNLVRKNYEIEKACLELEMEISQMKTQHNQNISNQEMMRSQEVENHETGNQEVSNHETGNQEVSNHEVVKQEANSQETTNQDINNIQEIGNQDVNNQETWNQDVTQHASTLHAET